MHGLQNIKRIYIQWVTVQQLLFGMVMLSAKQHSVFGTQSRELNEYEGVSVCLQRTACWIKPTEIAWPEPRNRNITNPPFHDIYKLSQTIFDYYSILYLLSETSVKVNQKKETARKRARVWDETVGFSEGTWYGTELKCCQVRFEPHTAWQNSRTWQHCNTLTAPNKVIARRQSDNWRLPKKAAPRVPLWLVVAFPSQVWDSWQWEWW